MADDDKVPDECQWLEVEVVLSSGESHTFILEEMSLEDFEGLVEKAASSDEHAMVVFKEPSSTVAVRASQIESMVARARKGPSFPKPDDVVEAPVTPIKLPGAPVPWTTYPYTSPKSPPTITWTSSTSSESPHKIDSGVKLISGSRTFELSDGVGEDT